MSDSINFQVPAEHLIFLATLIEELNSKETKEKLTKDGDVFWQEALYSLDISPTRSSKDKLANLTEEERFSLVMSYRQEAENLFRERRGGFSPSIRGNNLIRLANCYGKQKQFDKAEECLREAISSYDCYEAANALIELPGFDISEKNIRLAIRGLSQIENEPKAKLKAIELAIRYGKNRFIKAELAKIFFSNDPDDKNEASYRILNETGVTNYPELAAFMARKFASSGDDQRAFYWWGVALRYCYPPPDLSEVLAFTNYIVEKYPDPDKRFYFPDFYKKKLSPIKVESYYLMVRALKNMFSRPYFINGFGFILKLTEKSRAENFKYPTLHRFIASFMREREEYCALYVKDRILFIDGIEVDSNFISEGVTISSSPQTPEKYLEYVIRKECENLRIALEKYHQACGQWWNMILSSKHPDRFKTLFSSPSLGSPLPAYINSVPKDKICEIYRLTGANKPGRRDWLEA